MRRVKSTVVSASYFIIPFTVVVIGGMHLRHAAFTLGLKSLHENQPPASYALQDDADLAPKQEQQAVLQGSNECGCPGCCAVAKL